MFHGRKKQEKQELTQDQKKEIEEKLKKITLINQTLLKKRANKEYDKASLEQTEKFSFLSPDFSTLWNYRREIIQHLFETEYAQMESADEKRYEFLIRELDFLVKGIMKNPKSYSLWFHRQWTIGKGLEIERRLINEQDQKTEVKIEKSWKSRILDNELKLCDKMLAMDERNFHCWNYRLMISLLYLKEIPIRLNPTQDASQDTNSILETKMAFLDKECKMAENLIKKNFSNFSAWHYRSKLMPLLYEEDKSRGQYLIPFDKIKEDLALLKHAFFTDPKDQSPWNYHEWLISLIAPVQVASLSLDDQKIIVGLSHVVRNIQSLEVEIIDENGLVIANLTPKTYNSRRQDVGSTWSYEIDSDISKSHNVSISMKTNAATQLFSINGAPLIFRDFFMHFNLQERKFELPSSEIWVRDTAVIDNLTEVLNKDIANIKELIDFEKGLRFAVQKVRDLIMLRHEYLANPYYLCDRSSLSPLQDIDNELQYLTSTLKEIDLSSHVALHEKQLASWQLLKFKWEKIYESGGQALDFKPPSGKHEIEAIADRHRGYHML